MKRVIVICIFVFSILWLYATDYVAISEVMYDTPFNENLSIYPHCIGEYIELYNADEDSVDLSNWSLHTFSPNQSFFIPEGTILEPHSFLLIAYGTVDPYHFLSLAEEDEGWTDIHLFYNLCVDCTPVILQEDLILYNAITSLVLKDPYNVTRDSVSYHASQPDGSCYAANSDIKNVTEYTSLLNIYSVQRLGMQFNSNGTTIGKWQSWGGLYHASTSDELDNNSTGRASKSFWTDIDNASSNEEPTILSNYIQEITPRVAMSNIDADQLLNTPSQATVKRTYYDAMYRPTLTFLLNQAPDQNNLVTLQEYDSYARPTKEWLPIVTEIDHLTKNTFKSNVEQFYNTESRPFVEQSYSTETWDNGVIKNKVAGLQKAGADMNSHKTAFAIRGNNANEVKLFSVSSDGLLECTVFYQEGMLRVTQTTDEDNKTRVVYTNLHDQVVMEKVDNAPTYYVYNDLSQLCYILPPLAANQIANGTYSDTADVLKKYAYAYKYDERGNQIYKRLPGCEPIRMVYDKSNALVLSQTGNQRARGTYWTVYKYDSLRRLIYTAEVKVGSNDHDGLIDDFSQWLVTERFSTDEQLHPMSNTGYSRSYYDSHPMKLLTVNYYDDYQFLSFIADTMQSRMAFEAFSDNSGTANATGLLTGTRTYYLDKTGNYSETVYYYDYRGREIQRRTTNHLGGIDVLSTKYDFANNVTDTWSSQSTNNGLTTTEHYHYSYDHANRLDTTIYTFNDAPPIILQSYHYDELGRVRSRHIHGGIDSIAFAYDIRNQVTQIKSSSYEQKYYYNQSCPSAAWFSELSYNGNISATTWTYGNKINGYTYTYDNMNRLSSTYSILNNSLNVDYLYSEKFTYDPHGNITSLERWDEDNRMDHLSFAYNGNQLHSIDDCGVEAYHYDTKHYHDNSNSSNDFVYDANGNMIYDQDRGIAAIRYNLLNLPDTIQFTNGNLIIHRYDATGNRLETKYLTKKIATTVPLGNVSSTPKRPEIFYITRDAFHNNIVYTANNTDAYGIEFVHNPEGYIRYYGPEEHYHFYYIKDLLGNIRETYVHPEAGYKECIQRMQYYPSGLPWAESAGASEQPWKYNSKEFVEMHGLDEYDSKARWYYPAICRTTTMDPLAEKYYSTSPYTWCGNNFVSIVDPDGRYIEVISSSDSTYQVVGGQLNNDRGIYVVEQHEEGYQRTGEKIGNMLTTHSFFDEESNEVMKGATINLNDNSGNEFIEDFMHNTPSILSYMGRDINRSGRNGGYYDFKTRGVNEATDASLYVYRGMPLNVIENGIIGTARDAGNFVAGYIAGVNGIPFSLTRLAFNIYQGGIEPLVSSKAQNYGFQMGFSTYKQQKLYPYR